RQMYQSLGTPIESVAKSVRAMKEIATSILPVEDITEVGMYFDYLAAALD
ncbi:MAG: allophycocyanin, partial [Rivularia sp. (in: cyanobacteria)]